MGKRILIFGGARFHGYLLGERLLASGHAVSVLNRGQYRRSYPAGITALAADRNDPRTLAEVLQGRVFDVVIDNNGYQPAQIECALDSLAEPPEHYLFISSAAVYRQLTSKTPLPEEAFHEAPDPRFDLAILPYADGKRACEQLLQARLPHTSTIIRFPNIFGHGDFAGKLRFFAERLRDSQGILLEEEVTHTSLVYVDDAVIFIQAVVERAVGKGQTLNVCPPTGVIILDFLSAVFGPAIRDKFRLIPAHELRAKGCSLPFAWGPVLSTARAEHLFPITWTPVTRWGPSSLAWEETHLPPPNASFRSAREREVALIRSLSSD